MARTSFRQVSVTRPANTTDYTAKDAVGTAAASGSVLQFPAANSDAGRSGKVMSARLWKSSTGVTNDGFDLALYHKLPTATAADNAAPTTEHLNIADAGSYIGRINFNAAGVVLAGGVVYEGEGTIEPTGGLPFDTGGKGIIYGILETQSTYPPASEEVFTITLEIQQ